MTTEHLITGLDGKLYPRGPVDKDMRNRIVTQTHRLHHEGKSVRQIVAALAEAGVRRSVGTVHSDLKNWRCATCSGVSD